MEAASSALQPGIAVDSEKINMYRETEEAKHEAASNPGPPNPLLYRIEDVLQDTSEASLVGPFESDSQPRLSVTSLCESVDAGSKLTATVVYRPRDYEDIPHLMDSRMTMDSDFFGLTPLYTPKGSIEVDIIALTGLGGHAFGSWVVSPTEMWLRDFPPRDIPIRVLIYGYDSHIQKHNSWSILSDFINNFLLKLTDMRREGRYDSLDTAWDKEAVIKSASLGKIDSCFL